MRVAFTVGSLDSQADWTSLEQVLGDGHPEVVRNTIRHLQILDAKSYVLEEPYIDRDYSADYLEFYAKNLPDPRTSLPSCPFLLEGRLAPRWRISVKRGAERTSQARG